MVCNVHFAHHRNGPNNGFPGLAIFECVLSRQWISKCFMFKFVRYIEKGCASLLIRKTKYPLPLTAWPDSRLRRFSNDRLSNFL